MNDYDEFVSDVSQYLIDLLTDNADQLIQLQQKEYQPLNNRQESLKLAAELIAGRLEVKCFPSGVHPSHAGLVQDWGIAKSNTGKVKDRSLCVLLSAIVAHCESDQGHSAALSALIDLVQTDYLDPTRNHPLDTAFAKSVGFRPFPHIENVLVLHGDHTRVCIRETLPEGPDRVYNGIYADEQEPEPPPFAWGRVLFRGEGPRTIRLFDHEGWLHTKTDLLRLLTCHGISPGSTELEPLPTPSPETPLTRSPR